MYLFLKKSSALLLIVTQNFNKYTVGECNLDEEEFGCLKEDD